MEKTNTLWKRIRRCWKLYVFLIPGIVITLLFKYWPMYGIQLAFKDYIPGQTISEAPWVGLKHFERFFSMPNCGQLIWNTFKVAVASNFFGFPLPIILAIMLNQVKNMRFKKLVQNVTYMPYLFSIVVAMGVASILLAPNTGLVNLIIQKFGGEQILFYGDDKYVVPIYLLTALWQNTGYSAVIYLAALASVDEGQIEAARIDGANRFQIIRHVEIPAISGTIFTMLILNAGRVFAVGADRMLLIQTSLNLNASEILSTYVYKSGLLNAQFGFSTAVELFNTFVNIAFLLIVNYITSKISDESIF